MKRLLFIVGTAALISCLGTFTACSQEKEKPANSGSNTNGNAEVRQLISKVNAKLKQGKDKEADFTAELKEFDDLITKLKSTAPNAAAEAAFMRALLYVQVIEDHTKGAELMRGVTNDFPKTAFGSNAVQVLTSIERQAGAKKLQAALQPGATFPDFNETDINGKPFTLANYKGKVVLLDFWATWCGPCRAELPNVLETYNKYHSKGFEIMGISLDENKEKLVQFIKDKNIPWQQYFDGKGWENKLGQKYGITAIPATFLIDGQGKIVARDLYGEELTKAVAKAMEGK